MTDHPKSILVTPLQAELSAITQRLRRGVVVKTLSRDTNGHIGAAEEVGIKAHIADGGRLVPKVLQEPDVDPAMKLAVVMEFEAALLPYLSGSEQAKARALIAKGKQKLEAAGLAGLEL
jgi:hypothetical protein